MSNYRYCIYCHTNKVNGMQYVGRTHLNPLIRWGNDGSNYDENNSFGMAIKEYGWSNFTHEILEYGIKGLSNADERERYYIKELNSIFPNGYNTEDGGIHGSTNPRPPKIKRPRSGWKQTEETRKKMSRAYDIEKHRININKRKPVDRFDKEGNYICTYSGAVEASQDTGCDVSTISKACKDTVGRYKTVGGYIWKYHQK